MPDAHDNLIGWVDEWIPGAPEMAVYRQRIERAITALLQRGFVVESVLESPENFDGLADSARLATLVARR